MQRNRTLEEYLHDRFIECGECESTQMHAELIVDAERDFNVRYENEEILSAIYYAADNFVESMIGNEHDTEKENRTDIPPLEERIARWEVMRPRPLRVQQVRQMLDKYRLF